MEKNENENDLDYIAFHLCWGLARYDANEIVPAGGNNGGSKN